MTRMIIASASLAAALAITACGGGSGHHTLTVPASSKSKRPLPQVEPVRGDDYEQQALEGAVARWVQWGNQHYGVTTLDTHADNVCEEQVQDLWHCFVTINVVKPFSGAKKGPIAGSYTVTRDTEKNQLIYITGAS
jgi:hypothetical protein